MADASFLQTNFLGGEWSPFAQGRADMEQYRTACNVMSNYVALEVGAATRRSGTRTLATTRDGVAAALRAFHFSEALPFEAEFTPGHLRLFAGLGLLLEGTINVGAISSADPAVVATIGPHGFTTGDQVQFAATLFLTGTSPAGMKALLNRQFAITVIDTTHFSIADPVTGTGIDGSTINTGGWTIKVSKVVDFTTPYAAADLPNLRMVQNEDVALVLNKGHKPQALTDTVVPTADQLAVFAWNQPIFLDGPYLDPPTDGSTLQASAVSGTITLTASSANSINAGAGFLSTDVGRLMRLFSEPPQWNSGTGYAKGANVTYGNVQWQAIVGNTGIQPDTDPGTHWVINPTGAIWTWGTIASVISTTQVTLTLAAADPLGVLAGGSLLYSGGSNLITQWQMGLYSDTTGWPGVGGFHEGRFWLGGVTANRVDSGMANGDQTTDGTTSINFGPTLLDGSVPDNCGISAVFQGPDRNTVFWILPDHQGVIIGTQGGEWLMQASQLNEPLTPTSIQAHLVTRYGDANIEPRSTGLSHVFVHRYQLQLYEYITDVFSGKFIGTNIGRKAKHIISPGIAEIAYQAEKAPIVWCRTTDGRLLGCTYKRESPFSTQPASYMGWHHHPLGSNRIVTGIQAGPAPGGATDSLALVTQDTVTGIYYVEALADLPEETDTLFDAWYLDGAAVPSEAEISGSNLILYGLNYIAGDTVSAWIAGTDAGDHAVAADGTLTIPLPAGLLTASYLASLTGTFGNLNLAIQVAPPGQGFFSPFGSVLDYTSTHNPDGFSGAAWFDWDNNVVYIATGDGVNSYFDLFNIKTQALETSWTQTALLTNYGQMVLGYDYNLYLTYSDDTYKRFNTSTQTLDQSVSWVASGYGPTRFIAPVQSGGEEFIIGTGLDAGQGGGGSAPWWAINMTQGVVVTGGTGSFLEGFSSITLGNAFLSLRGPPGGVYAAVYGAPGTPWTGPTQTGIYFIGCQPGVNGGSAGAVRVATITGPEVVGSWTSVQPQSAPVYDETDGNLLINVTGSDATNRLIKVNTATGALMWVLNVPGFDFSASRIRGGRLTYQDTTQFLYINTLTGAFTTQAVSGLSGGTFATDDVSGVYAQNIATSGTQLWDTFGPAAGGGSITPAVTYNAPSVIGFTYDSDLQILRPVSPQESGSQNGPAQGKTKRLMRAAPYFANTVGCDQGIGVKMGTYFTKLRSVRFQSPGGTVPLTAQQLFTGIYRDTVDDDYSFNGMWCCRTSRPYPTTVVSVECFLHTQDL